jgi:putative Ig domain-containing protein
MPRALAKRFPFLFLVFVVLVGCGGGANMTVPPSNPVFSSVPEMVASEGTPYSYQLVATSPDNSAVTFALATGPAGATLSGNTVSWTPTHAESRTPNAFSVTASNASGGSASQAWSLTPSGTIQIKAVTTYWTPTGTVDVPRVWLAGLPYPAALVPQNDGSLIRLQGAANADGTFSIPDVPGSFYWLQLSPSVPTGPAAAILMRGRMSLEVR